MEPKDWIALSAAGIAAFVALASAIISSMTLWITVRRDRVQWAQAALEEAFVGFLTCAYSVRGALKHIDDSRFRRLSRRTRKDWLIIERDSHEEMLRHMSRIRMLASEKSIDAMVELKRHLEDEQKLFRNGVAEGFSALRNSKKELYAKDRDKFIRLARQDLSLARKRRMR